MRRVVTLLVHPTGRRWIHPRGPNVPITYSVNGLQYIATPSGWGSIVGRIHSSIWPDRLPPRGGSTLMVFKLPKEEGR